MSYQFQFLMSFPTDEEGSDEEQEYDDETQEISAYSDDPSYK